MKKSLAMDLQGQTILITGAAGRIGSSIAKAALEANAIVLISDISKHRLGNIHKELSNDFGAKVHVIVADASTANGIDQLIEKSLSKTGRIDGAVHAAYPISEGWGTSFEDLKEENLHQNLIMQLGGAILFSQKILSCFKRQSSGNLVHLSSIQGVQAPKFDHYVGTNMNSPVEYTAIKSGIIGITKWLAKYHPSQSIRVNCVSPGGIIDNQPESFLQKYRASCTNIGMLSAKDVAKAVVFLLSPSANAINGQNLIIDDGWTL